jgi:hypothetical protein
MNVQKIRCRWEIHSSSQNLEGDNQPYMRKILLVLALISFVIVVPAQVEEPVLYYQMEPFDDSLFIEIQNQVFIDPPDPKAEIIVDLRDANNQTVSIKGTLYPFLAFSPEIRARVQTYPFKLNLEDDLHYFSVFTRVIEKIRIGTVIMPATLFQISPGLHYVNPFLQVWGGERFGIPLKSDIGVSFGLGTPYSGPMETNLIDFNFHILGFTAGIYSSVDAIGELKEENSHNNLFGTMGYKMSYVIPFGNFFEAGYLAPFEAPQEHHIRRYSRFDTLSYHSKLISAGSFNWEFRYPFSLLGSTRGKFYVASYLNEWHIGFSGRELGFAGSVFDLRIDAMPKSDIRQPQYMVDIMVQRIFENWAFSAIAIGPTAIFSTTNKGKFGVISVALNLRLKVGSSL